MTEPAHGQVVLYSYLWAREHDRGEEAGRRTRSSCVMLIIRGEGRASATLLFPITSRPPGAGTRAVAIPETEARRAKLRLPAWVIVDEFNTDTLSTSYALESREPLGIFSGKFMARIAAEAAASIRGGLAKAVPRR